MQVRGKSLQIEIDYEVLKPGSYVLGVAYDVFVSWSAFSAKSSLETGQAPSSLSKRAGDSATVCFKGNAARWTV